MKCEDCGVGLVRFNVCHDCMMIRSGIKISDTDQVTAPKASADDVRIAITAVLNVAASLPPGAVASRELDVLREVRDNRNWVIYVP